VSIKGSPYAYFRRTLETRKLSIVLPAAAELPWISLADSLVILTLMAQEGDPRFQRSAARWIGRLLTETPAMTLKEARWAIAMVEQLPRCRESLHRLAQRRPR
jgi:chorismate-pyruvate lyase